MNKYLLSIALLLSSAWGVDQEIPALKIFSQDFSVEFMIGEVDTSLIELLDVRRFADRLEQPFYITWMIGGRSHVFAVSADSSFASLSRDSLESLYKYQLIHRSQNQVFHPSVPSDSTEYAIVNMNGAIISPDAFLTTLSKVGYLQLPGSDEKLVYRLFTTQFGRDWIEPYSIEKIFGEIVAARDTLGPYQFTFPADHDTVRTPTIRFQGWVRDTSATLLINGDTTTIYPTGAFAGLFEIQPDLNSYPVQIISATDPIDTTFHLFYQWDDFDPFTARVEIQESSITPRHDQIYYKPEQIVVRFSGTSGGEAKFKIPRLTRGYLPMRELTDGEGKPTGTYEGAYYLQPGDHCKNSRVIFQLKGEIGSVRKKSSARITVDQPVQPVLFVTPYPDNLLRYSPGGEILSNLPPGIELEAIAKQGRWWKVKLSGNRSGYMYEENLSRLPDGGAAQQAELYSIFTEVDSGWVNINFRLTEQVPFKIAQGIEPQRLSLYFYRTRFQDEWTVYPDSCPLIDHYDWIAEDDDIVRFDVYLNTSQQWGYSGHYEEGRFVLKIKQPPVLNPRNPFAGLTFVLDAGHGGKHKGAVGPTGLCEKDVNLVYTQYLGKMLQERGALAIPTRQVDSTMWLSERMDIARAAHGDIFLWLHNNAPGSSRDPLTVSGTSTYYTSPQNWPLARFTYPHLVELGLEPFGQVHRTYYITRQTDMLIFLVEGAFMTHPEDEMFMTSDENLQRLAAAVLAGIEDFLNQLVKEQQGI